MIIEAKLTNPNKGFWKWVQISLSPAQAVTSLALRLARYANNNDPVADPQQPTAGIANSKASRSNDIIVEVNKRGMIKEEHQTNEISGDCDMSGDAIHETEEFEA
jgi:hypothetical protein